MNNICDDLQDIILDYIPNYPKYLSNCQLVCKRWKHVLQDKLDTVYWNKVEGIIGEIETDKLKQGTKFEGLLDLDDYNIGDEGCRHLTKCLKDMKGLKRLHLSGNNIGADGCYHLAPVLAEMKGLERLWLRENNIGEEGKKVMREAWEKAGKHVDDLRLL